VGSTAAGEQHIRVGLDIGSVYAKMAILFPGSYSRLAEIRLVQDVLESQQQRNGFSIVVCRPLRVLGDPVNASEQLLNTLEAAGLNKENIGVQTTGSQGKRIAETLGVPFISEFKAVSQGVVTLLPKVRTILEIGGDGSKYVRVAATQGEQEVSIVDYAKNGDCAAGTGSFIDQQAARLCYRVEEIGPLVQQSDGAASIAGRCSVFAKSDMVHAQQRGYSPGAIFKGLCEAVVRNYIGTVLRGKELEPVVAFVGGVAANAGVVDALQRLLNLKDQIIVPPMYNHVSAIGAAYLNQQVNFQLESIHRLAGMRKNQIRIMTSSSPLDLTMVRFAKRTGLENTAETDWDCRDSYLGLDVGSVSTNLVLLDEKGYVIDEIYTRTEGRPVEVVTRELLYWQDKWANRVNIIGVGTTGSGRELIGQLVGADVIHDEITAHKTGASFIAKNIYNENVDTIFEIGGQDSKYISIEDDVVIDFAMNEACAAGTGSFLEEQAAKLGISIKDEFSSMALESAAPVKMGERCTVFMEKDVTAYMQQGISKKDIAAGLAYTVVFNYLNRVVRGRKIGDVIYFQGGTAYNRSVAAAFASVLHKEIIVPPHNGVMGAIGVALLVKEKRARQPFLTRFKGFNLHAVQFSIRNIQCKACTNQCDVQEINVDGEKTYWGDKCSERFRKRKKLVRTLLVGDLFAFYKERLFLDGSNTNGFDRTIGIPRTMYVYDYFPFWNAYFKTLGFSIVLSDETNKSIISKGRELCVAEPCFPIIISHGHVVNLLEKNVDFIFVPAVIDAESEFQETQSWVCPWGQTLSLIIKNIVDSPVPEERLLFPAIHFQRGIDAVKKSLRKMARQLGVTPAKSDRAVELAYRAQDEFRQGIRAEGQRSLELLRLNNESAVVVVGRPYNVYDFCVNLNVPLKLREDYGINVVPMDFLPLKGIAISDIHENMFWNYGRRILQAARYVGMSKNLHLLYFTNFKCGPDSYIKHFVRDATGSPYLTLQFDGHSNDAGIMTRCEAYLESKGLMRESHVSRHDFFETEDIVDKQLV
jgi:predicted CoA-substrate-specific enzyme activase